MPDYVIIAGKTVVNANTDVVARNVTANGQIVVTSASGNTTIGATGITVKDLTITGNTTLKGTSAGASTFNTNDATGGVALTVTSNSSPSIIATSQTGNTLVVTAAVGTAHAIVATAQTGNALNATSGNTTLNVTTSGTNATNAYAIVATATSPTGQGIFVSANSGYAIEAKTNTGVGINVISTAGTGVYAESQGAGMGLRGVSNTNYGVVGQTKTNTKSGVLGYSSNVLIVGHLGYNGTHGLYSEGPAHVTGALTADGTVRFGTGTANVTITGTSISTALPLISGNTTHNGTLSTGNTTVNGTATVTGRIASNTDFYTSGAAGGYYFKERDTGAANDGWFWYGSGGGARLHFDGGTDAASAGEKFVVSATSAAAWIHGNAVWHSGNFNPAAYQPAGSYQPYASNYIQWDQHIAGSTAYAIYGSDGNIYAPGLGGWLSSILAGKQPAGSYHPYAGSYAIETGAYRFNVVSGTGTGIYIQSSAVDVELVNAWSTSGSGTGTGVYAKFSRGASTNYDFYRGYSSGGSDLEFKVTGNGIVNADGGFVTGADYAEFFEWQDGNPDNEDRRGIVVVLDGAMIRPATDEDDPNRIIGVVSATPSIVGDSYWDRWKEKYLRDEYGKEIYEDVEIVEWVEKDEDGNDVNVFYDADKVPHRVTVPEDARYVTIDRKILNPAFDPNEEYIPRDKRKEWATIGLMGKLRVRNGQPIPPRWLNMGAVTSNLTQYLVR